MAAVVAVGDGPVGRVDPGDDLLTQVGVVLPGAGRVEALAAAVPRPRVDEHDDRRRYVAGREERIEQLRVGLPERRPVEPHPDVTGVPHRHVDRGVALVGVVVPGRQVDEHRPLVRITERVPAQQLALVRRLLEPAVEISGPRQHGQPPTWRLGPGYPADPAHPATPSGSPSRVRSGWLSCHLRSSAPGTARRTRTVRSRRRTDRCTADAAAASRPPGRRHPRIRSVTGPAVPRPVP